MLKVLVGVLVVAAGALGVQWTAGQREALRKAQDHVASLEAQQKAQPPSLLAFELDRGADKKLATADLCGSEVVLLYVYSNSKRDATIEKDLALVAKENPGKVRVVPVRTAGSEGPVPKEIASLGTPVTDTQGAVMQGYRVQGIPTVVILKSRPVYHGALSASRPEAGQLEQTVDGLVARDDLVPAKGGCSGECGAGGGSCMGGPMMNADPGSCSE
ncbi:MAG: hypothetical protein FJX75_14600 [Armatimonadetes bacterium]|nr:hypothetical protein [Armatimonadota bacterium]